VLWPDLNSTGNWRQTFAQSISDCIKTCLSFLRVVLYCIERSTEGETDMNKTLISHFLKSLKPSGYYVYRQVAQQKLPFVHTAHQHIACDSYDNDHRLQH
jgi:hypothetical protein